eukprot:m.30872 g.30872  ORF g.30872 m.30872 type:complete len:446 (-) comp6849_c0_seq1:102-1439(-)
MFKKILLLGVTVCTAAVNVRKSYVVSFHNSMDSDTMGTLLDSAGAIVERQLTCTRGVVASLPDSGHQFLQSIEGAKLLNLTETSGFHGQGNASKSMRTRRSKGGKGKGNGKGGACQCPSNPGYSLSPAQVTTLKNTIKANIDLEAGSYAGSRTDSIGELLRLVFHDAMSFDRHNTNGVLAGANGCINLMFFDNRGLQDSVTFLQGVQNNAGFEVSMADLVVIGGIAAIEAANGPTMPFRSGRLDTDCSCEPDFAPNPESDGARRGTSELRDSLVRRLGLSERDVAAIMGSHTVGRTQEQNIGFEGGWIPPPDRSTFNNLYYVVMFQRPWVKTTKASPHVAGQDLTEWRSPLESINAMMLNTDAAIGFEISNGCNIFGEDPLNFLATGGSDGNPAPFIPSPLVPCRIRGDKFGRAAQDFAADNNVWLAAYEEAFTKMTERTVPCWA